MANRDRMREDFEEWATGTFHRSIQDIEIMDRSLWPNWQAACRAQAKRDAEICRNRSNTTDVGNLADEDDICAELIEKDAGL